LLAASRHRTSQKEKALGQKKDGQYERAWHDYRLEYD
jgi:hypothetical protein